MMSYLGVCICAGLLEYIIAKTFGNISMHVMRHSSWFLLVPFLLPQQVYYQDFVNPLNWDLSLPFLLRLPSFLFSKLSDNLLLFVQPSCMLKQAHWLLSGSHYSKTKFLAQLSSFTQISALQIFQHQGSGEQSMIQFSGPGKVNGHLNLKNLQTYSQKKRLKNSNCYSK